jgi:predicted nucleotidyltransferase component of viral defense system
MPEHLPITIDIRAWIEKARADPLLYVERQATDIVLNAIAGSENFGKNIYLKGGVLMGIAYHSPRQTMDIDYTISLAPTSGIAEAIRSEFDRMLAGTGILLGYPDILCRVQTFEHKPRKTGFESLSYPSLKFKIAYVRRESRQEILYNKGQCPNVIEIDINFNEPVDDIQILHIQGSSTDLLAYSLTDLIAEKLRALLQQKEAIRDRYRRQDVYDIASLLRKFSFDETEKKKLLEVFLEKCAARHIKPNRESLSDPEVIEHAKSEWNTLKLEVGELPSFEECFQIVEAFYRSLPW